MLGKMRWRHRRSGRRTLAYLLFTAAAVIVSGCREPTQIKLELTTDVPCSELPSTSIRVGLLGDIDEVPPVTTTSRCDPATGRIGSLVAVPRGEDDAPIAILVTTAFGKADANCKPPEPGCIEARRLLHYLPYKSLVLPIPMRLSCAGIACDKGTNKTCIESVCRDWTVDPTLCASAEGCGEDTVGEDTVGEGAGPHSIALGERHTCARKTDGTLWCWGRNEYGQLGDGTLVSTPSPVQVSALGDSVAEVAAGYTHTCARKTDGTLWCWGHNEYGQLGDGTTDDKASPVQVSALGASVAEVAAGYGHTCARETDGRLWCWGRNDVRQLDDGTTVDNPSPVEVTSLSASGARFAEVAAGESHTCARKTDGTLWCWGWNYSRQLGNGTTGGTSLPVEVAAGGYHTCARKTDGTLWCWGDNNYGQSFGDGSKGTNTSLPVQVSALGASVAEVAAGYSHTCARKTDGTLWCWGYNGAGQLGDGTTDDKASPGQVSLLGVSVAEVDAGVGHTCARKTDGTLWCWGWNDAGQLGDGIQVGGLHLLPVKVW